MKLILITILTAVVLQDLKQTVHASCPGNVQKQTVAFGASKTTPQSLSAGDVIKFQRVWTNAGNGFNVNTGIFTAPIEGEYQFASTLMVTREHSLYAHLKHNNVEITALFFKAVPGHNNQNTLNAVLHLKKGDTVSIKSGWNGQHVYSDSHYYSTFSGHLI